MAKKFIVYNASRKKLGEIIYSGEGFEVKVSFPQDKNQLEKLLDSYFKKGISDLGEVILKEPIKPDHFLFLSTVRNQLAQNGYVLIEE